MLGKRRVGVKLVIVNHKNIFTSTFMNSGTQDLTKKDKAFFVTRQHSMPVLHRRRTIALSGQGISHISGCEAREVDTRLRYVRLAT